MLSSVITTMASPITNRGHPPRDAKAVLQAGCPRTVALTSWRGVVPGGPVRGGRQGRVSPRAGAAGACPRTISRTPRDGNIRQGAHTPGDGVWGWRHRPEPGHTTHTPHTTKDQAHQDTRAARASPRRHARNSSINDRNRRQAGKPLHPLCSAPPLACYSSREQR